MIVHTEILLQYRQEVLQIVEDIDEDDAIFIACAFYYQPCLLWTDDKKLKRQSRIILGSTDEILSLLEKKS